MNAYDIALEAHDGQTYGHLPYITHVTDVLAKCRNLGLFTADHIVVATLHDAVEDGPEGTCERVREAVTPQQFKWIDQLTRKKGQTADEYFNGLEGVAFEVKVADRLANLEAMFSYSKPRALKRYYAEASMFALCPSVINDSRKFLLSKLVESQTRYVWDYMNHMGGQSDAS